MDKMKKKSKILVFVKVFTLFKFGFSTSARNDFSFTVIKDLIL